MGNNYLIVNVWLYTLNLSTKKRYIIILFKTFKVLDGTIAFNNLDIKIIVFNTEKINLNPKLFLAIKSFSSVWQNLRATVWQNLHPVGFTYTY